jgi:hypothetical protein
MEILRDENGKPQGVIREIAGGQERPNPSVRDLRRSLSPVFPINDFRR